MLAKGKIGRENPFSLKCPSSNGMELPKQLRSQDKLHICELDFS